MRNQLLTSHRAHQTASSTYRFDPTTARSTALLFCVLLMVASLSVFGQVSSETNNENQIQVQTPETTSDNSASTDSIRSTLPTQFVDDSHIAEAKLWFLIFLGVMIFLYIGQFGFCFRLAKLTRAEGSTRKSDPTIWQSLRKDVESQFSIWAFVIMAFFIPFMLGIVPDVALLSGELLRGSRQIPSSAVDAQELAGMTARVVYGISVTVLTVLITVEFTYLANAPDQRIWQRMLVVALALDIITLIILSYFIFDPEQFPRELGAVTLLMIGSTGFFAFLSSFLIIICVRELGLLSLQKLESRLSRDVRRRRSSDGSSKKEESAG